VLRVQLPHLDDWSDGRRAAAAHYEAEGLGELVALPRPAPGSAPAWHLFVARHPRADDLVAWLVERAIGARAYYRVPAHRQPAMRPWAPGGDLPGTDEAARTHLAVPMSPVLDREQAAEVVAAVRAFPRQ
jgi:dTDP-4-amino-4,6-dideoxygalactose transaminase